MAKESSQDTINRRTDRRLLRLEIGVAFLVANAFSTTNGGPTAADVSAVVHNVVVSIF